MNARHLLLTALLAAAVRVEAAAPVAANRTVSGSRQFTIFSTDKALRSRVASLADEVKGDVLGLLGERIDRWKIPVIIALDAADELCSQPVTFQMISTPGGAQIDIAVRIGSDPAAVNLHKQLVRAVLLELAYRDRPPVRAGERYLEAPWWLTDGIIEILRRRDRGVDTELFTRLVETNRLPSIQQFVQLRDANLGATANAIDSACALGLVQLLLEQPDGPAALARLVRHWPANGEDPVAALGKEFSPLAANNAALQKWWTLNIARYAASSRYRGLTLADSGTQLAALLSIELPIDKAGTKKIFAIADYPQFLKLPAARTALLARQRGTVALSAQAHALLQPVVAEYEEIFAGLAKGKTRGIADRIARAESYRATVVHRMAEITDYLNWYEATQLGERSNSFDGYLKAAEEFARSEPISKYLDLLQKEY